VHDSLQRQTVRMSTHQPRQRTYEYLAPFTDFSLVAQLDGLEIMRRVMKNELPPPPITATLGFSLIEVERGRAVFEGTTAEWQYNPLGTVHGGWSATLLDSALGCAVHSTLGLGELYTTLDLQVRFVRAVLATSGKVRAEARVVHAGKRVATAEARLVGAADETLYATATASCLVTRAG
jgi:uncharacterized protein (TIGR00369 family)